MAKNLIWNLDKKELENKKLGVTAFCTLKKSFVFLKAAFTLLPNDINFRHLPPGLIKVIRALIV